MEALKRSAPELVTETDEAILKGADIAIEMSESYLQAKKAPDSFLTDEQFEALLQASKSNTDCWDAKSPGECPKELAGLFGGYKMFYSLLRHPTDEPTAVMWNVVRKQWPILEGVPDDELQKNLIECRKEPCDPRFL